MTVERFRREYYPFSNMYVLPHAIATDCGIDVPTSEHAYMANRFVDIDVQEAVAVTRGAEDDPRSYSDALAAKELAHDFIKQGAEQIFTDDIARVALMRKVIEIKLERNPGIASLLLSTGSQAIEEGNTWGDTFWGISPIGSGQGKNHLGNIYMELRKLL